MFATSTHAFVHIPKTGGISISQAIKDKPEHKRLHGKPNTGPRKGAHVRLFIDNEYGRVPQSVQSPHVPIRAYDMPEGLRTFSTVRNPWSWYVCFYHFMHGLAETANSKRPPEMQEHRKPPILNYECQDYIKTVISDPERILSEGMETHPLIANCAKYMVEENVGLYTAMVLNITCVKRVPVKDIELAVDDYIPMERMSDVKDYLGVPAIPHLNKTKHPDYKDFYNDELRMLVAVKDSIMANGFGYTFEGDFNPGVHDKTWFKGGAT